VSYKILGFLQAHFVGCTTMPRPEVFASYPVCEIPGVESQPLEAHARQFLATFTDGRRVGPVVFKSQGKPDMVVIESPIEA
jgi:hypothetical protein